MTSRPILSPSLIPTLEARDELTLPSAAQLALPERAVQFGTGALLRGLVDALLDDANRQALFDGRVVMIGSTGSGRDRAINDQGGLFTLVVQGLVDGQAKREFRVVSSVSRALAASTQWAEVLRCAENPGLELIFSNTTEIGIVLDETDVATPPGAQAPRSFPAKLAAFLLHRARWSRFDPARAPVVIPTELIEGNGDKLRGIVTTLTKGWSVEPEFAAWLDAVPFCNTLVDRIVPGAPDESHAAELRALLPYDDGMITIAEPYRLFAIEGGDALRARLRFAGADEGIIVAGSITPYRLRKVRLLNGAHTSFVSLAILAGCQTVREAVKDSHATCSRGSPTRTCSISCGTSRCRARRSSAYASCRASSISCEPRAACRARWRSASPRLWRSSRVRSRRRDGARARRCRRTPSAKPSSRAGARWATTALRWASSCVPSARTPSCGAPISPRSRDSSRW